MNLPSLKDLNFDGKRVLLRMDLDVPIRLATLARGKPQVADDTRIKVSIPTILHLVREGASRILILGHRGRPGGVQVDSLSLGPIAQHLEKLLTREFGKRRLSELPIYMLENLRFNPAESADPNGHAACHFASDLAKEGEVYINDAFGVCHREQASIVDLPKLLPHAAGLHLAQEVSVLEKVLEKPKKPVVFILGGGKEDKSVLVHKLLKRCDILLVGGLLPKRVRSFCDENGKMCVVAATLTPRGDDITTESARNFIEIIGQAKTIVWNGPMGDIDNGFWEGTKIVGEAVAASNAFKIAGGGDTIHALKKLGLFDRMDYVSVGGGAFLEFLAYGDLPGLRALREFKIKK